MTTRLGIVGKRKYNRVQRETLSLYREVEEGGALPDEEQDKEEPYESLAITLSNVANVVLLILKVISILVVLHSWNRQS